MEPIIPTLRSLPRLDLLELLAVLCEPDSAREDETSEELADRLVSQLNRLLGIDPGDDALLERHVVSRLANGLKVDYDPTMSTAEIRLRLARQISDCVIEDLRPFVLVAVCVGWSDGRLSPEEIAVMDAALSRLKLLSRRRGELLALCAQPISAAQLSHVLTPIAGDDQKAWSVLALGWAVALADLETLPAEEETFFQLAAHLGVDRDRARALKELVARRFYDSLEDRLGSGRGPRPRALAQATMAAITAAELDSYLRARTGLKSLSLILSSPCRLSAGDWDSTDALDAMLDSDSWVGAPAVLAGALFLRRLGGDELSQHLLVLALTCLERSPQR